MPAQDLSKLIKWLMQEPWGGFLQDIMGLHLGPAMTAFELEFEEIDDVLGGMWGATLWGVAFEDALTRRLDGRTPVDAYLERRGWTESTGTKRYLAALQTSVMSLYEVSELTPGQSFRARDLLRGGEPVLVSERSASRTLKTWDRIAARLVPQGDRIVLSGGLLAFTPEGCELLAEALRDAASPRKRRRSRPPPLTWTGTEDGLREAAPLFTLA